MKWVKISLEHPVDNRFIVPFTIVHVLLFSHSHFFKLLHSLPFQHPHFMFSQVFSYFSQMIKPFKPILCFSFYLVLIPLLSTYIATVSSLKFFLSSSRFHLIIVSYTFNFRFNSFLLHSTEFKDHINIACSHFSCVHLFIICFRCLKDATQIFVLFRCVHFGSISILTSFLKLVFSFPLQRYLVLPMLTVSPLFSTDFLSCIQDLLHYQ